MNWLKKGPELKMPKLKMPSRKGSGSKGPDLKPPGFLADLYYDLRDRRLLPVIALVLVAIAAVPFLLGGDSEEPALPEVGAAAPESPTANVSSLTVVEATPGLRDYRERLRGRSETDPFEQQYTEPASNGSSSEGGGSAGGSSSDEATVTTESSTTTVEVEAGEGSPGGSGGSGSGGQSGGARLIEFVFDVQISHSEAIADGGRKMSEPEVRRKVKALTQLPGKKIPVVTLAGVNLRNGKVFLLVSDEVRSLDGDFTCETRPPAGLCELLEIETGFPLELVYGPDEVLYRIKVTKIDAVWAGKVGDGSRSSRASFGGPAVTVLPTP